MPRSVFGRPARWPALAVSVPLAAGAPAAIAQQDVERRVDRLMGEADPFYRLRVDTDLTITERSSIDWGGYVNFLALSLEDSTGERRSLLQPEVTLYTQAAIDGAHTFFARASFQYREFSEGDSFDGEGDRWTEPFLDRYWYEFDLERAAAAYRGERLGGTLRVRAGRQFVDWGAGLTLSETLYAVQPMVRLGAVSLEGLVGITPSDESVTDFDASREEYNTDTERFYAGGLLRYVTPTQQQFYAYVLDQDDRNGDDEPRAFLPFLQDVEFDYDSTYWGVGARGTFTNRLLYLGEFVYETGESRSDPLRGRQTVEDIRAWAARAQLVYLFQDDNRSRLELEAILGSGDDDRLVSTDTVGGNLAGTDDTAFNSLGFVNTGLAFAPSPSNLLALNAEITTFPFPHTRHLEQLQVGLDAYVFSKLDEDAPIDQPTAEERYLGFETDLIVNWRLTSDLAIVGRYGLFFPGDAIVEDDDPRHFAFIGLTLSF